MFRVYVGNLPYRVREEELARFFEDSGCTIAMVEKEDGKQEKDLVVPVERRDDRFLSKGFGFVSFADKASFDNAIKLDGTELEGRALKISEARQREDRSNSGPSSSPAEAQASSEEM